MLVQPGILTEEYVTAAQIERELETEDLVLLSQLRKAIKPAPPVLPYVANPSLARPGAAIAAGR